MEDKVRKLGPMIGHYFSTFQSLNVMTRNDMDRAVKKMYCFKSIRDAEEELFQAEQDWDSFLKEVDHTFDRLCGSVNDKELGSYGPCELKLTDVSTESPGGYAMYRLNPLKFHPGLHEEAGARRWLKDTNCNLRMFVDPERHLYSALGLRRSLTNAWSISKLVFYAEQKRAGRRMFEEDDPNQIGGDFILDEQGRLALIHRSKIPTDKPSVEELLSCVKDLDRAKANS
ncbi:unnamed protein product [Porites evermanni]|uniref:Uncharacterized protein n=1 Tax=Porites evermanni TaxID=104178 RepID=A0ABN8M173_9CNID|nr:unnamed protein product [Porites evermanni]